MTTEQKGKLQIADYQVLTRISSGGMGDVLLVRHSGVHGFEKLAAIKIVRSNVPNFAAWIAAARLPWRSRSTKPSSVSNWPSKGPRSRMDGVPPKNWPRSSTTNSSAA